MEAAENLPDESDEDRLMKAAQAAGMYPRNLAFVIKAFLAGGSYREVAYKAGVSKTTVEKIAKLYREIAPPEPKAPAVRIRYCPCGKPSNHKGWCSHRLRPRWHGASYPHGGKPAYMTAIERATARIHYLELRDEVRQELAVQYLESKLTEEQFTAAAEEIRARLVSEKYSSISLDDYAYSQGEERTRIIDTMPAGQDLEGLSQALSHFRKKNY
jgi:hypothetical protein